MTTNTKNPADQIPTKVASQSTGKIEYYGKTGKGLGKQDLSRKIYAVKAENWDKNLPYYFVVCRTVDNTERVVITETGRNKEFDIFYLPINPQNISFSLPFAINVTPTTRGILEEHNGLVFTQITISGTTGLVPMMFRQTGAIDNSSLLKKAVSVAPQTLGAIGQAAQSVANLVTTAKDEFPPLKSAVKKSDIWHFGHAQLHQLRNYFVSYAEYKKLSTEDAKKSRLVFVSQKDGTAYVVTPLSFEYMKNNDNPHIFTYKIVLRAWDLADNQLATVKRGDENLYKIQNNNNLISKTYNSIREARSIISAANNAIKAVFADIETMYGVIRETMMAVKQLGQFGYTLADFPEMAKNKWQYIAQDFQNIFDGINSDVNRGNTHHDKNLQSSLDSLTNTAQTAIEEGDATNASLAPSPYQTISEQAITQTKLDIQNPFNNFDNITKHLEFLDELPLSQFELNSSETELIDVRNNTVQGKTINDYDLMRVQMEEIRDAYADSKGLSDADYDAAVNRDTTTAVNVLNPTSDDYLIIKAFNDIIASIDTLAATNSGIREQIPDPFIRAQNIVAGTGIEIRKSNVAFPVPFPFGGSLEQLASTYLGDANRWIEISLVNELKEPYIDEDGFYRYFTTSGNGNSFTVNDVSHLFLNQEVFLSSVTQREERRQIISITELSLNNYLITVDGDNDLSRFTAVHQAKIKAYMPNTVNSSKVIYIPLDIAIPDNPDVPDTREITETINLTKQQKLMGVDLGLTDNFDLAVANDGDIKLSVGFANAIQAIRLKLGTEQGQLKQHTEYGSNLVIGERLDYSAEDVKRLIEENILSDSRFVDVPVINVEFTNSTVKLNLLVKVTDGGGLIPLQFKL